MAILKLDSIHKTYNKGEKEVQALKGVSLELNKGEILAVMGSSGSGKSTLLNIIGGLDTPDYGEMDISEYKGNMEFREPELTLYRRDFVGFVFQRFNLIADITVRNNIEVPLLIKGISQKEIETRVEKVSKLLGIKDKLDEFPNNLSGGQQQRVAIARGIVGQPKILLADEPTGALDVNTSREIMNVFKTMNKETSQSIIIVTHDPTVAAYADKVLFLSDGSIFRIYENKESLDENKNAIIDIFKEIE